jgi:hypothetical protein
MIKYALTCGCGHAFEGWFKSSAAFDRQARRKLVACPRCGGSDIRKAPMAPRIAGRRKGAETPLPEAVPTERERARRQMVEVMRELKREVEAKAEYVGADFAEEARRIHYDEARARGIYGEASRQDAQELIEEGIMVVPLPILPEEHN